MKKNFMGDGRIMEGIECWDLSGMFYRNLEDKNIESSAEDGGLICENSEESLKTLLESFVIFN